MVECESVLVEQKDIVEQVLIDTWWNVNISAKDVVNNSIHVLIDTWWNVNVLCDLACLTISNRFNRYMVECEFTLFIYTHHHDVCFNRYMVECECVTG